MRLAPLDTTKMEVCGRIATTPSALELCTAALSTFMDLVCPGDVVQLCMHVCFLKTSNYQHGSLTF